MFHMFMFLQTRTVVDIAAESGQLIPSPHPLPQLYSCTFDFKYIVLCVMEPNPFPGKIKLPRSTSSIKRQALLYNIHWRLKHSFIHTVNTYNNTSHPPKYIVHTYRGTDPLRIHWIKWFTHLQYRQPHRLPTKYFRLWCLCVSVHCCGNSPDPSTLLSKP